MNQDKTYHQLIAGSIYLGGASDVPAMVAEDGVQVVVDLREESTGCAAPDANVTWIRIPLGDDPTQDQVSLFKTAIDTVVGAYREGKKVGFHCGGGKGRTGTVAAGVLLELGECKTLDDAEARAKAIRPVINIKPEQRAALQKIYPDGSVCELDVEKRTRT
ncbi:dual specificity protein phosphatase family protein [Chitinivorax sp. PXF-14]|uniref:protein-tyrosine phosphatase family protein n=1 Tax=Chitinivorax sp. PXF-14 TaxID=3230488 RepID=UPI003466B92E